MNRRTTLLLPVITLVGLPTLPQLGLAQSDSFLGIWQLNVAKSQNQNTALDRRQRARPGTSGTKAIIVRTAK
jgi:hypothetical protein